MSRLEQELSLMKFRNSLRARGEFEELRDEEALDAEQMATCRRQKKAAEMRKYRQKPPVAMAPAKTGAVTVEDIAANVCQFWGVTRAEVFGHQHVRHIVRARHACWWLARHQIPNLSYPALARMFLRADHSVVMYGVKRIDELLASGDSAVIALVNWATGAPVGMAAE